MAWNLQDDANNDVCSEDDYLGADCCCVFHGAYAATYIVYFSSLLGKYLEALSFLGCVFFLCSEVVLFHSPGIMEQVRINIKHITYNINISILHEFNS